VEILSTEKALKKSKLPNGGSSSFSFKPLRPIFFASVPKYATCMKATPLHTIQTSSNFPAAASAMQMH
jgi:hypothetical protein